MLARTRYVFLVGCLFLVLALAATVHAQATGTASGPLRVSTANPRYFMDGNGQVVYLTGSHTWSNFQDNGSGNPPAAFDYNQYLDFLGANKHNFFRLWVWEQARWTVETSDTNYWFNPQGPFVRTGPGSALDGGLKWDLNTFDQGYFDRLRARVVAAGQRGMYVSLMLFDGWSVASNKGGLGYQNPWRGHPYNKDNNINGVNGDGNNNNSGEETHELANAQVLAYQKAYIRKVIDTVNDLDNVLYEVSNESHSGSTAWQYALVDYIKQYEGGKAKQHPVGMTVEYPNGSNAELFGSHADWVSPNGDGGYMDNPPAGDGQKVVIVDTDHLWGIGGDYVWVWKSFTRGLNPIFMDGYDGAGYGVGGDGFNFSDPQWVKLRANLGYTRAYAQQVNLAAMTPSGDLCSTGYCLANPTAPGAEFIVFQPNGANSFTVKLNGLSGSFAVEWLNPETGSKSTGSTVNGGSMVTLNPPFGNAVLYLKQGGTSTTPTSTPIGTATSTPTKSPTPTQAPSTPTPPPPPALKVTTSVVGQGTVEIKPAGTITCGQVVTITAISQPGWSFVGWTGDTMASGNPLIVSLYRSLTLIANFASTPPEFDLAADVEGAGAVNIKPPGPYRAGQVLELTALAQPGWRFESWAGALQGSKNPLQFQVQSNLDVTARFVTARSVYMPNISTARAGQVTGTDGSCQ